MQYAALSNIVKMHRLVYDTYRMSNDKCDVTFLTILK